MGIICPLKQGPILTLETMNWELSGPPNSGVPWTLLLCVYCTGNNCSSGTEDVTRWGAFLGHIQGPGLGSPVP